MITKILEIGISLFCAVVAAIIIMPLHLIFAPLAQSNQPCVPDDDDR